MTGWIKLHRKIKSNIVWDNPEYLKSWIDILLSAQHKPTSIIIKSQVVGVDVGEVAWSDAFMQNRWGWSRNKVRLFIKTLIKFDMISVNKNTGKGHLTTILTICNYKEYQQSDRVKGTAEGTAEGIGEGTAEGTQGKNVKNYKNDKNKTSLFEVPDWVNQKAFQEFVQHRKEMNKPFTDLSKTKVCNKLKGFTDEEQQTAINTSIESRWAGVFPKKLNGNNYETAKNNNARPESNLARLSRQLQADISAEDPFK
jgi:hypothetical protein